jgi:hypothetical protein
MEEENWDGQGNDAEITWRRRTHVGPEAFTTAEVDRNFSSYPP